MRVVFDSSPQRLLQGGRPVMPGEGEQVVVLRRARADSNAASDRAPLGGDEYRTSDEARLLDASVRAHERLHELALGPYADSSIQLTTRRGADGEAIA
ncbi:MAG: hypothetical protein ACOC1U_04610, partial [Spirochaetota bacterium]